MMNGTIITNKEDIYKQLKEDIKYYSFMPSIIIYLDNYILDSRIFNFFLKEKNVYIQTTAFFLYGNIDTFLVNNKTIISTIKAPIEGYITSYEKEKKLYQVHSQYFSFKIH